MEAGTKPRHATTKLTPPSSYSDATATETSRRRGVPGVSKRRIGDFGRRELTAAILSSPVARRIRTELVTQLVTQLEVSLESPTQEAGGRYQSGELRRS